MNKQIKSTYREEQAMQYNQQYGVSSRLRINKGSLNVDSDSSSLLNLQMNNRLVIMPRGTIAQLKRQYDNDVQTADNSYDFMLGLCKPFDDFINVNVMLMTNWKERIQVMQRWAWVNEHRDSIVKQVCFDTQTGVYFMGTTIGESTWETRALN